MLSFGEVEEHHRSPTQHHQQHHRGAHFDPTKTSGLTISDLSLNGDLIGEIHPQEKNRSTSIHENLN